MNLHAVAECEDERRASLPGVYGESFADGAEWGAMWLAAILGMAHAIKARPFFEIPLCRKCARKSPDLRATRLITINRCAKCGGGAEINGGTRIYA